MVVREAARARRRAHLALFDATTLTAKALKEELVARSFPIASVRLFTSQSDPDHNLTEFAGEAMLVTEPDPDALGRLDIAFLCGVVVDLLSGVPLGVSALVFLFTRAVVLPQRRYFVDRLFPFVWGGFTVLAAAAIAFLWLLGSFFEGAMLDMRTVTLQWVLTVASFPAVAYLLMRVQRAVLPPP